MALVMPLTIGAPFPNATKSKHWEESLIMLHQVRLKSSVFDSWNLLLNNSLKLQLEAVRRHPSFEPFLTNALRIETQKQSRHKTHVITVELNLGTELGQILGLKEYEVTPVAKVIENLSKNVEQGIMTQQGLEKYKTEYLDLENAPELLRSRQQYPNNALLPVIFYARNSVLYVMPNFSEIMNNHAEYPVKKCDKKAREAFVQLQRAQLPPVPPSPPLH
eukprot:CAMPEP_0178875504 /NCGR_PEP_ID=MMETSP0747-20121128/9784_1 /TAXON_ID=913974 /ORGANISM="Nitzschia punctata, Strain CCMP561" /LENGTH=218 /DNA_ID=CAMNT_0020542973 /DNA_START=34 /DNA_END=690 /DNA_ORIENTATION=+